MLTDPTQAKAPDATAAVASDFAPLPDQDVQTDFSIYDVTTGQVRITGHCPYTMIVLQHRADTEGLVLERLDSKVQFVDVTVDPPKGKSRPSLAGFDKLAIKADNVDTAVLNLPIAGTVTVDGVDHACPAGPMVFTCDSPGTYAIAASIFPYLDFATEVVAS